MSKSTPEKWTGELLAKMHINNVTSRELAKELDVTEQYVSMLIIDKKRMKIKDAGLPQAVLDQTPKALRGSKMPIIKAKIGPQIMSLICEEKIFDDVPVKKEVKAAVSGIYVLEVKGLHGTKKEAEVAPKKGFKAWVDKLQEKAGAKPIK